MNVEFGWEGYEGGFRIWKGQGVAVTLEGIWRFENGSPSTDFLGCVELNLVDPPSWISVSETSWVSVNAMLL